MIRKVGMFLLSLVLVAAAWEIYKLIGPADGGTVLGAQILPRTPRLVDAPRLGHALALR